MATLEVTGLNTLISTTVDSVNGYERSAQNAEGNQYQQLFRTMAQDRRQVVTKLQARVRALGGEPEDDGSNTAALHRGWQDLTSALTGSDDKAVINEVERGEDYLKEKWEAAMKDDGLSSETRALLTECWQSVRQGHDQVRDIKHSMERTTA